MQLTNEPHMSHVMLNFDYKVKLSFPFRSVHIFCMIILLSQTMEVGVPDIVLL
jgi:hypothetical protein